MAAGDHFSTLFLNKDIYAMTPFIFTHRCTVAHHTKLFSTDLHDLFK